MPKGILERIFEIIFKKTSDGVQKKYRFKFLDSREFAEGIPEKYRKKSIQKFQEKSLKESREEFLEEGITKEISILQRITKKVPEKSSGKLLEIHSSKSSGKS